VKLRFLADENLDHDILRGLRQRDADLEVVHALDAGLAGTADPDVLLWAERQQRVLLTHDVNTMPGHAYARLVAGEHVAGVCIIPQSLPVGQAIEELLIIAECSDLDDWKDQVRYQPL
jgi:hypothetical protein